MYYAKGAVVRYLYTHNDADAPFDINRIFVHVHARASEATRTCAISPSWKRERACVTFATCTTTGCVVELCKRDGFSADCETRVSVFSAPHSRTHVVGSDVHDRHNYTHWAWPATAVCTIYRRPPRQIASLYGRTDGLPVSVGRLSNPLQCVCVCHVFASKSVGHANCLHLCMLCAPVSACSFACSESALWGSAESIILFPI